MIGRRRFVSIVAGAGLGAVTGRRAWAVIESNRPYRWNGVAMGASASIVIAHEAAPRLVMQARAEIARLERIFSLYRADSALSRLNATGRLPAPPFELLELLSICNGVHQATGGAFDPTVQPLWALYAERHAAGAAPARGEIAEVLESVGWQYVALSREDVVLGKKGMALTLNGIAQGYISDKVADLLRRAGVSDVLVDIGEIVALGRRPDGMPWRIGIAKPDDPAAVRKHRRLSDRAIATSSPLGTVLDDDGRVGHILDPRTGYPGGRWRQVSVIGPRATRADALSTAFCLMEEADIAAAAAGLEIDLLR